MIDADVDFEEEDISKDANDIGSTLVKETAVTHSFGSDETQVIELEWEKFALEVKARLNATTKAVDDTDVSLSCPSPLSRSTSLLDASMFNAVESASLLQRVCRGGVVRSSLIFCVRETRLSRGQRLKENRCDRIRREFQLLHFHTERIVEAANRAFEFRSEEQQRRQHRQEQNSKRQKILRNYRQQQQSVLESAVVEEVLYTQEAYRRRKQKQYAVQTLVNEVYNDSMFARQALIRHASRLNQLAQKSHISGIDTQEDDISVLSALYERRSL